MSNAEQPPFGTQLFRFFISGGFAALVDFGLLWLLMRFGLDHNGAKAISFIFGTTTAYLINRRWTFKAAASKRRFVAVVALYGITFAIQFGIWAATFPWLLGIFNDQLAAQVGGFVLAQGVASTVNFLVQRMVIFKPR